MEGDDNLAFDHQDPLPSPRSDASAAAGANNRWNPTRDQIEMLENFYRQGIRTPSAEQIQQITSRLRTFGHIEGKNVFYWFQNHKARLRQKQKQESAYLNRFFHRARPPPILPPPPLPLQCPHPCPNGMYSPYYMPVHGELGFYQQSPYPNKLPLPGGAKRRPRTPKLDKRRTPTACRDGAEYEPMPSPTICEVATNKLVGECENETLPLFPLQPTGILERGREAQKASGGSSDAVATYVDKFEENAHGDDQQPFYDFFSGGQG